jgi:glycosyltransferase involved in cell wall biosynthesis
MEVFYRQVRPQIPEAQLWMVCGDAPSAPGVEVLGRVGDEELADRYRRAWVFCLPSTYEGFGVPYAEALASGTAVVATPNRGARDVLGHGAHGRLVADEDLGLTLVDLLLHEDERDALARKGPSRAADFDWRSVVARYETIYRELLASPPRTRTWPRERRR